MWAGAALWPTLPNYPGWPGKHRRKCGICAGTQSQHYILLYGAEFFCVTVHHLLCDHISPLLYFWVRVAALAYPTFQIIIVLQCSFPQGKRDPMASGLPTEKAIFARESGWREGRGGRFTHQVQNKAFIPIWGWADLSLLAYSVPEQLNWVQKKLS